MADLTTPETEAPERVWIEPYGLGCAQEAAGATVALHGSTITRPNRVEYLRADIAEAALSAARREAEEARERALAEAISAARRVREGLARSEGTFSSTWEGADLAAQAIAALRADTPRGERPDAE